MTPTNQTGRFFQVSNAIFDQGLSRMALLVYMYLSCCADRNGCCFPSVSTIGEKCGIQSRSTVHSALRELVSVKLLISAPRSRFSGGKTSNSYRLQWPRTAPSGSNERDVQTMNKACSAKGHK